MEFILKESLRYLGSNVKNADEELISFIKNIIKEVDAVAEYRHCHKLVYVYIDGIDVTLGDMKVTSKDLAKNLDGCTKAIMFVATLGPGVDMLLRKSKYDSLLKASTIQAVSAALIEDYCDKINEEFREKFNSKYLRPRYSPGYGDFELNHQINFLKTVEASKRIGVSLTDGLLMVPTKSVSAVIGISDSQGDSKKNNCSSKCFDCSKENCIYRKRG